MQQSFLHSLLGNAIKLHVLPAIALGREGGGGGMCVHVRASVWCKRVALSCKYTEVQVLLGASIYHTLLSLPIFVLSYYTTHYLGIRSLDWLFPAPPSTPPLHDLVTLFGSVWRGTCRGGRWCGREPMFFVWWFVEMVMW